MVDYTKLSQTALNLITDNGKAFTLRNKSEGTFDPATNVITSSSDTDETVQGVITNFKKIQIDDKNIKRDDKLLILAAKGITGNVDQDSIILDGSVKWNVINIEQIDPGGTVLIYKVHIRR